MIGSKPHGGPEVEMLVVFSQDHFIDVYGIPAKDEDARRGIFDRRIAKLPRRLDAETGDERIAQPQERAEPRCWRAKYKAHQRFDVISARRRELYRIGIC